MAGMVYASLAVSMLGEVGVKLSVVGWWDSFYVRIKNDYLKKSQSL